MQYTGHGWGTDYFEHKAPIQMDLPLGANAYVAYISAMLGVQLPPGPGGIIEGWSMDSIGIGFLLDYILLTPSMADEYLEIGKLDYTYRVDDPEINFPEQEVKVIAIEVPGLREIILSARGLLKNWAGTGSATFIIPADRVDFVKLLLDGEPVDESFYIIREGSTIIELSEEYLKTLDKGEHKFTAEFKDGVEFDFFVAISDTGAPETPESVPETPESVPETGIGSNVAIWITIACISALGIAGVSALYLKGKRQST